MTRLGAGPAWGLLILLAAAPGPGQEPPQPAATLPVAPQAVAVEPAVSDASIAERLTRILNATEWFSEVAVRVDEGVVFLEGTADSEEHQQWAGELTRNTEGVVAVVNGIEAEEGSPWDLTPAWIEIQQLASAAIRRSPLLLLGLLLFALCWVATLWAVRSARALLAPRISNRLLQTVGSRAAAAPLLLLGFYVALRVAGLTGLAVTVLGGTGLIGLIIGVAFRDIAENFLASLMLSIQNPFASGDLISVAGHTGLVQSVNTRSTLLMTLEGNHVQIPNATIYKETITNFTANPNTRFDFSVGIGYQDSIENAQAIARELLTKQEGLVPDPEPWVIVEALGAATVNLRIYFWVDTQHYNGLKVRSAVIRRLKRAYEAEGISMPDEAREVVFPSGVPVHMVEEPRPAAQPRPERTPPAEAATKTEGSLASETKEIEQQAQQARTPEGGPNLLEDR